MVPACGRCVKRQRTDQCFYHPNPLTQVRCPSFSPLSPPNSWIYSQDSTESPQASQFAAQKRLCHHFLQGPFSWWVPRTDYASSKGLGHLQGRSRLPLPRGPRQAHTLLLSPLSRSQHPLISREPGLQLLRPHSTPTPPTLQHLVMLCASPSTGQPLRLFWTVSEPQKCARMLASSAQIRIQTSCPKACASWSPFPQTWMPLLVHNSKESISAMIG